MQLLKKMYKRRRNRFLMASPVNVGVNDARNTLNFDRSSSDLKDLKDQNFSFTIIQDAEGQSQAKFEVTDNKGEIVRRNMSKPFSKDAIQKKSTKLTKDAYVVEVKKQGSISLHDLF